MQIQVFLSLKSFKFESHYARARAITEFEKYWIVYTYHMVKILHVVGALL